MAIARGAAILGREEQDGTLEMMLLARPKPHSVVLAKAAELLEMLYCGAATATLIALLAPHFQIRRRGHRLSCDHYTSNVSLA